MEIRTIIRLPKSTFFDIEMISKGFPDKAKPFVRRGRKAAGLLIKDGRAAEGWTSGRSAFLFVTGNGARRIWNYLVNWQS
jgi:hypothetical protein